MTTNEELKEFWEWCGFKELETKPELTLDNLFKWAVPKVDYIELKSGIGGYSSACARKGDPFNAENWWYYQDKDPALALYQVIDKVRKEVKP
jgi:hypothetical protein